MKKIVVLVLLIVAGVYLIPHIVQSNQDKKEAETQAKIDAVNEMYAEDNGYNYVNNDYAYLEDDSFLLDSSDCFMCDGEGTIECNCCDGTGENEAYEYLDGALRSLSRPYCEYCNGKGYITCDMCNGGGID